MTKWWCVADPLHPAEQLAAHAFEARFLGQLADHGLRQRLPGLDPPAGDRPLPRPRAPPPPDQQEAIVDDDDGPDADLRPGVRRLRTIHARRWWTDDRPGDHAGRLEEVLRGPHAREAEAVDGDAAMARSAQATAASSRASPTPTPRASAST